MAGLFRPIHIGKRGSVIVDAACSLPIFIIAMAMLIMLIPQLGIEESAERGLCRSALAVIDTVPAAGLDGSDTARTVVYMATFAAYKREEGNISAVYSVPVRFGGTERLESGIYIDNIAHASAFIKTAMPAGDLFFRDIYSLRNIVFRPFAGESPAGFSADNVRVYVFPRRGERYHTAECSVLKNGAVQTVLSASLRKRLKACSLCDPGSLPDGAPVYMYSVSSGTYHRKKCSVVEKSYVSMPRSEAIERGFTPCMKCGGGE